MGEIGDALQPHRIVGIDTSIFIYHLEDVSRYSPLTTIVLHYGESGRCTGVTSVITLAETTVAPIRQGNQVLVARYVIHMLDLPHLLVADIDQSIALRAAQLRAVHRLRTPDALQIAACLEHGATAFVTNDRLLRRVTELQVLILDDFLEG